MFNSLDILQKPIRHNMLPQRAYPCDVLCRLGFLFGQALSDKEGQVSSGRIEKKGQCQLGSGCMPPRQVSNDENDTPGWVKELERVTKKVG